MELFKFFKKPLLAFCTLFLFLLTGCWDKVELENRNLALVIGVDRYEKSKEGNEDETGQVNLYNRPKRFNVSVAIPEISSVVSGGSGNGGVKKTDDDESKDGKPQSDKVKIADNETLSAAMRIIDSFSSRSLYFGHTKAVILSEKLLNDDALLKEAVDALERNSEINQKMIVLATDKKASDILAMEIPNEPHLGLYISNFFRNNANAISITTKKDLENFIKDLRANGNSLLPKISHNDNGELRIGGAGVIKDFKFVGWLDETLIIGCLWTKGEGVGAQIITEADEVYVPLRVSKNNSAISFYEDEKGLNCKIGLTIEGSLEEFMLLNESISNEYVINQLQRTYENTVIDETLNSINYLQNELQADAINFREILRKFHYSLYEKYAENNNWEQSFKDMTVHVSVNVKITNAGSITVITGDILSPIIESKTSSSMPLTAQISTS